MSMSKEEQKIIQHWSDARVYGYVRKSLVLGEEDRISEVKQRDAIAAECARLHLQEPEWHADVDGHRSGRYEHTRPGWRTVKRRYLMADKAVLVAYELDRSNRNVMAMAQLIESIRAQPDRFRLVLVMNRYDSARDGWGAREIKSLLDDAVIAQFESDKASERMSATAQTLRRHLIPWGRPAYGYQRVGRGMKARLVPAPFAEQARIVLRAYADGEALSSVWMRFNATGEHYHRSRFAGGQTTRHPEAWDQSRCEAIVRRVMQYAGFLCVDPGNVKRRPMKPAPRGSALELHAEQYHYVRSPNIEPIVDDELAERVISARASWASRQDYSSGKAFTTSLSGLAYYKGEKIRAQTHAGIRRYRTRKAPSMSWSCVEVDAKLDRWMSALRFPPSVIAGIHNELQAMQPSPQKRAAAEKQRRKLEQGLLHIERRYALGDLSESMYRTLSAEFHAGIGEYAIVESVPRDRVDRAIEALNQIGVAFAVSAPRQKNMLLSAMFERVNLDQNGDIVDLVPRQWAREAFGGVLRGYYGANYQAAKKQLLTPSLVTDGVSAADAAEWLFSRIRLKTDETTSA
jgi:DNA invertase Pin-like site-specific DNA recombinase